jgi:hypothetical protein
MPGELFFLINELVPSLSPGKWVLQAFFACSSIAAVFNDGIFPNNQYNNEFTG